MTSPSQLDRERRRLTEEVAEARALLEGREREVEEVKVQMEAAVAAREREGTEHKTEVDEVRRGRRGRKEKGAEARVTYGCLGAKGMEYKTEVGRREGVRKEEDK